jgi:hypothetical protein
LASIFQLIGPLTFTKGLSIGISTVPEKYTAATATFNLSVDIEENFADSEGVQGLTLITDTNNTLVLQQANLPKRVFSLSIAANEGVPVVYPMLFNVAATPDGIYPMIELSPIANGITKVYYFGVNGFTFPNPALAGSVVLSSTPTVLTGTLALASPMVGKVKT